MRIIGYVSSNSGPAYHRVIMPLMLMKDVDVYITNDLKETDFEKGCNVFFYNRVLPDQITETIATYKKKYGFKVCVDIDDIWNLDPHHILYDEYIAADYAKSQIKHISEADFVFTTHNRLAKEIEPFNKNVHILPNAIPKQGQFDIERKPHHLTRLFWQGSITHREDIAQIRRPIDCLNDIAGKIQMVMAGYMDQEDEWYKMVLDYTAKTKHQYKLLPGVHVTQYYQHYEHADICLVPLLDSPFNKMKSNLKVLEAANLGLPVICSHVHPYLDLPVLYAKGAADWISNIKRLVASKKRQREAGAELKDFCDKNFNFHKINQERKTIFEHEAGR